MSAERPLSFATDMLRAVRGGQKTQTRRPTYPQNVTWQDGQLLRPNGTVLTCPFGVSGDRLWVRERFAFLSGDSGPVVYSADPVKGRGRLVWKQSRYLPREASRVLLEVIATRAERLQAIGDADARAEGYPPGETLEPVAWFRRLWDRLTTPAQLRWNANPWVWVVAFRVVEAEAGAVESPVVQKIVSAPVVDDVVAAAPAVSKAPRLATMEERQRLVEMIRAGVPRVS